MFENIRFVKNYRTNSELREGFFKLANNIFGLHFKEWYEKGFWDDNYVPYSFILGNQVVANVSINFLELMIEGSYKQAIQIGTVMTHPEYRNKGLSKKLMNKVLEEYENKVDLMYLFANESVLEFYPKFGFQEVKQYQYSINFSSNTNQQNPLLKLDIANKNDLAFLYKFASNRIPVSQQFGTANSVGIFMYYCLNVFHQNIYYHEKEDIIVIYKKDDKKVDLYDLISKEEVSLKRILMDIVGRDRKEIIFHFTPDDQGLSINREPLISRDALFVGTTGINYFPELIRHPITSEA